MPWRSDDESLPFAVTALTWRSKSCVSGGSVGPTEQALQVEAHLERSHGESRLEDGRQLEAPPRRLAPPAPTCAHDLAAVWLDQLCARSISLPAT